MFATIHLAYASFAFLTSRKDSTQSTMAGRKTVKVAQKTALPLTAEEENLPPKRVRRTVSVSTLFQQKHELKRKSEREAHDILAPKPAGVFKSYAATRHSRGHENPVFRRFQGTPSCSMIAYDG